MLKTIVTHTGPDVDAIGAVWVVKSFFPNWDNAEVAFVQQGTTWKGLPVDTDENIIHVDTGSGRFDHHQLSPDNTCACQLVVDFSFKNSWIPNSRLESVSRISALVNELDHFKDVNYPAPEADFWPGFFPWVIDGFKKKNQNDFETIRFGMEVFDGLQLSMANKVHAESDLESKKTEFDSSFGKGLLVVTDNDYTMRLAQRLGYQIVITTSPRSGHMRIKLHPESEASLEGLFQKIISDKSETNWYLHPSKKMLINPFNKTLPSPATSLTQVGIIQLIKSL